jgi:hypothetical protein
MTCVFPAAAHAPHNTRQRIRTNHILPEGESVRDRQSAPGAAPAARLSTGRVSDILGLINLAWGKRMNVIAARVSILAVTLVTAGCAGAPERVDYGGVARPEPVPADAIDCASAQPAFAERAEPDYPLELIRYQIVLVSNGERDLRQAVLAYDVNEAGQAVNVRHVGSDYALEHRANRAGVKATLDALLESRLQAPERFTKDCELTYEFFF